VYSLRLLNKVLLLFSSKNFFSSLSNTGQVQLAGLPFLVLEGSEVEP